MGCHWCGRWSSLGVSLTRVCFAGTESNPAGYARVIQLTHFLWANSI